MSLYIKPATAFRREVYERFYPPDNAPQGYAFDFNKMKHIRFMPTQVSLWSGINGHGKSLALNQLMLDAKQQGERLVVASLEMLPARNLQRTARQIYAKAQPTEEEIERSLEWCTPSNHMDGAIYLYDFVGRAETDQMFNNFIHAVEVLGCTTFIVDSLMKMGLAEDDYNNQKLFVEDLTNFAMKYNCHMHLVAHSKKREDESKIPGKMDVHGAGGITNLIDNGFSVWRNKTKEHRMQEHMLRGTCPSEKEMLDADAVIECWKSRDLGSDAEMRYQFWYDKDSMQYMERPDDMPKHYNMTINPKNWNDK